jgi:predicted regulator of Ras-like GTPase activity (Roadblock/LC7/MglB family)
MFGAFKKLLSKLAGPPPAASPETVEPAHAPEPPPPIPFTPSAPPTVPAQRPIPARTGDMIVLPLDEILSRLPNTLAPLVLSRPGGAFSLSADNALEQLRTGAVRIPFAQLRQSSPPGTFQDDATHDDSLIDLPLPLVLAAIGPAGLARRADQKRADVPDDVTGVFGAKLSPYSRPAPSSSPIPTPIPFKPAPVAPKPIPPVAPIPMPVAPKPVTPVAPPAPAPVGEKVTVAMEAVSGAWPDPVRQEIQQLNLWSASLSIPVNRLDAGMKIGRVVFTWAEVAGWLSEPPPPSAHGQTQVELPLPVIAPLFLARHRAATPRKTVNIGENVPELFTAKPRPAEPPPARPSIASTTLKSAQDERFWEPDEPPPMPAAPKALEEISKQPSKTDGTPREMVERILALPEVAGALLASRDGLLVAGRMPAPLKAETMAAFLPRIFTSVSGCAEEVQLGALRALRLSASQAPCAIFKTGTLFLAVLGLPGRTLPDPALEQIAGELAQQNH